MRFNQQQIRMFVRETRLPFGEGWRFIHPDIQRALYMARALQVVVGLDRETVNRQDIEWLTVSILTEAGMS